MVEERVEAEEKMEEYRRKLREFKKRQQWRVIKIRRSTYEQVKKLAEVLDIKRHKVIDLSVLILSILISEKIVFSQDEIFRLGLQECVERWGYNEKTEKDWGELNPACILKKIILPFYKRKRMIEALMKNIESLSQT